MRRRITCSPGAPARARREPVRAARASVQLARDTARNQRQILAALVQTVRSGDLISPCASRTQ
eukprot:2664438-Rhodomonas_salina.1